MEKARELPGEKAFKITTVTEMLGLRDPSQFIADFRREFGVTPATFRKMHRSKSAPAGC